MIPVSFGGVTLGCYQAGDLSFDIVSKATTLLTGDTFVSLASSAPSFPRTFNCYTADYTEISQLQAKIGDFSTLIIDGVSYINCYISSFGNIHELILGSGKYTYEIKFGQADEI